MFYTISPYDGMCNFGLLCNHNIINYYLKLQTHNSKDIRTEMLSTMLGKNRNKVYLFNYPLKDLKIKTDALMATYRKLHIKVKSSIKTGSDAD